ncbi:MAG: FAD-dependent oxidoreductase [Acidobacteria bacterium]|nr:FAD-dependent oxidoreductase [Acidobacteriota bacterium]
MDLLKTMTVFWLGVFDIWLAVPAGMAMRLHPFVTGAAAAVGGILAGVLVSILGERAKAWLARSKGGDGTRPARLHRIWNRYGAIGLGLLSPLLIGGAEGIAVGVILGAPPWWLLFWTSVGTAFWTVVITAGGSVGLAAVPPCYGSLVSLLMWGALAASYVVLVVYGTRLIRARWKGRKMKKEGYQMVGTEVESDIRRAGPISQTVNGFPYRTSYWFDRPHDRAPRLEGTGRVDVAVVGGGFAGLSAARSLKEADSSLEVALVESEHVGFGASGRNGGGVSPIPPMTWLLDRLDDRSRREDVRWAIGYIHEQSRELGEMIQSEGIDCDYRPAPIIVTAPRSFQRALLRWLAETCGLAGVNCRALSAADLRDTIAYPTRGGLMFVEGHMVHPFKLARGLREILLRRGVRLYEDTRVARVLPTREGVDLLTADGARLHARKVVLATNAYTSQLRFGPRRPFPMPVHTYLLATEPLDDAILAKLRMGGRFIGDTAASFCYARIHEHRLLFGGGDKYMSKASTEADRAPKVYERLHAEMLRYFPFLADTRLDAAWGGPYHQTFTDAPIVRPAAHAPNVVLNIGYGSGGVAQTQFSGRLVAGLVLGERFVDPDAERLRRIFETTRAPIAEALKLGLRLLPSAILGS